MEEKIENEFKYRTRVDWASVIAITFSFQTVSSAQTGYGKQHMQH